MHFILQQMYFHFGYDDKNVLFKGLDITSIGDLVGFMVAFVLLSICYEGLKAFRETIRIKELARRRQSPHGKMYSESHPLVETVRFARPPFCSKLRLVQAFLHVLQMFMGYILMLAFMAYNAWVCIAILIGGGIGHLLFTWLVETPLSDSSDHCM